MPGESTNGLSIVQLAFNSLDLPGTLRLYSELFGFANAGCRAIWGPSMRIQGLAPESRAIMWWLVGRDAFFQLEIFQHTNPRQRPQRDDWRPCDHGWVRFGVAVSDFDRTRQVLKRWGIAELGPSSVVQGLKRVAFRDPFIGVVVEILEDGPGLPGGVRPRGHDFDPSVVYITSSVFDLSSARLFYEETLGLTIEPLTALHEIGHEDEWGLTGAKRDGFLVRLGQRYLEIVRYEEPLGRPRRADHLISDQGILNVGIGCREPKTMLGIIEHVRRNGLHVTDTLGGDAGLASYVLDPDREVELLAIPEATEPFAGFRPGAAFPSD
jgi:hypothetical protein